MNQSNYSFSLEVIICNDGSTDESYLKLLQMEKLYHEIRLFTFSNRGVSPTRNFALDQVSGDYVWFIDADDYVNESALHTIDKCLNEFQNVDVVNFGYIEELSDSKKIERLPDLDESVEDGFSYLNRNDGRLFLWNNIYRVNSVREKGLRFLEELSILEDSIFNINFFTKAYSVASIKAPLYIYCYNENSISKTKYIKHQVILAESSKTAHLELKKITDNYIQSDYEYGVLNSKLTKSILGFYYSLLRGNYSIQYIYDSFEYYEKNDLIPLNGKVDSLRLKIFCALVNAKVGYILFYRLYRILMKLRLENST